MDITYHATIQDFATHVVSPATHRFADGSKAADFSGSGSASGLGDILFHAKYGIPSQGNVHVAAALDLRVPSGDTENMLGGGSYLTQFSVVVSSVGRKVSPHANLGYTVASGSGAATNQVNYIGGVEYAVSPRLTVLGDFVGRNLRDSFRLTDNSLPHEFNQGPNAPTEHVTLDTVQLVSANPNTVWGTGGVKFSPWRNLLISASVLVALNDSGLRSRVTPTVGFEFAF
jgi:hypothetical protein